MLQAALNRWFGPTQSSGVPVRGSGLEPFFVMPVHKLAEGLTRDVVEELQH